MLDDQCQRFQVALKVARRQLQELRETRRTSFVDSSWQSPSKKEVYEFCGESAGAVAVLQKKDGTLTGAHGEMDDMLREAWRDTFQMYTALPEPSWEAFREIREAISSHTAHDIYSPHTRNVAGNTGKDEKEHILRG